MNWDCMNYGIGCNDVTVIRDTFLCSGILIFAALVTLIWGKVKGYTNAQQNPYVAHKSNDFAFAVIAAVFGGGVLIAVAWIVGKVFG